MLNGAELVASLHLVVSKENIKVKIHLPFSIFTATVVHVVAFSMPNAAA